MKMACILGVVMIFVGTACSTVSINYQRSVVRAGSDLSVTTLLETQPVEVTPAQVVTIATAIKKYLETVDLSTVTTKEQLIALIKENIQIEKLKFIADKLAVIVPSDISNISLVKKVLVDACEQMIIAANKFDTSVQTPNN